MDTSKKTKVIAVIGGGAAGFFGSIACAEKNPSLQVVLFEKSRHVLSKVKISGGGRCNVTNGAYRGNPREHYPRGYKELVGPLKKFAFSNTAYWFETRGVKLKTEADGRMFPITDDSNTIIQCLINEAKKNHVDIRLGCNVEAVEREGLGFILKFSDGSIFHCDNVLIATGSNSKVWDCLKSLGHTISPPVPSLFTFNVSDFYLKELAGISVPDVSVKIKDTLLKERGPLLITHWGFSGPAILKLSAWGARILQEKNYQFTLEINWSTNSPEAFRNDLLKIKKSYPKRLMINEGPSYLPKNLWKKLAERAGSTQELLWSHASNALLESIVQETKCGKFQCEGKSTNKEEFVTCGGVTLREIDFRTMESKICPGLYFAGEVLDIDGITGGFNFQNAWTTSWIAGKAMAKLGGHSELLD